MYFLKRDPLYFSEKVYEIRRKDLKTAVPITNADKERIEDIPINDMRGMSLSLAKHGFCYANMEFDLQPEDFQKRSMVIDKYLPQLTQAVKTLLGASRIQIYDFIVFSFSPDIRSSSNSSLAAS